VEWVNEEPARLFAVLPWTLWCVWWLFAVDWRKAWPMLAAGGWVPAVLLLVMASMAWAMIDARPYNCLGVLIVPNGWWQLGCLSMLAALALICGWLQDHFAWAPPEICIEPPPEAHEREHNAHLHDAHL